MIVGCPAHRKPGRVAAAPGRSSPTAYIRCRRPIVEDHDYLDDLEEFAAPHDEYGDPRWTADGGTDLQRAIAELANHLRSCHYDGECLDH